MGGTRGARAKALRLRLLFCLPSAMPQVLAHPEMITLAQSIAPKWFVLPLAFIALLVVAVHWMALGKAQMPVVRKRLRTANGLVMMLAIPVLAYSFGVVDVEDKRRFVLAWMTSAGLLIIVLLLAIIDLMQTFAVARQERMVLRDEFLVARAKAIADAKAARAQTECAQTEPAGQGGANESGVAQPGVPKGGERDA
jgi:hypothetical protein